MFMIKDIKSNLELLFRDFFLTLANSITPLPQGGSDRKYYRITAGNQSAIGAYNPDIDENRTFIYLTRHFTQKGLPVPKLLGVSMDEKYYLLNDLGDQSLFNLILQADWEKDASLIKLIKNSLSALAQFQVAGAEGLDFSKCYPKTDFDLQSVMWDFNYFKYSFLKPSGIKFNETKLDDDFLAFANVLLSQPSGYFQYRDFQSRNVMVFDGSPHFIDYQGGRRGPLLYDVTSFLYQARANFSSEIRQNLFEFYLDKVNELTNIDRVESRVLFPTFALFRVIQTLGAYGFRGFFERRTHFLQSIPLATANLEKLLNQTEVCLLPLPSLRPILAEVYQKFGSKTEQTKAFSGLTVEITSFSYKKGYPLEHPEHGGGFVFDCRALPNPGRIDQYKMLTGLDKPVIEFLNAEDEVGVFFNEIAEVVMGSVDTYLIRGFEHLSVSFGCTGGQHRSVYMAHRLAERLKRDGKVRVIVKHREINI